MTQKEKIKRLDKLDEIALNRYLDRTNFDRVEWLDDKEKEEYVKLYREVNGECLVCGNDVNRCICENSQEGGE